MKIYYPTYTRLDSLAIGVLIGYLFQNSSVFREFHSPQRKQTFLWRSNSSMPFALAVQ
jgi:hypothetical protein